MSLGEIKQKMCANPVFTVISIGAVGAGIGIAVKGVLLTAAAISTAASAMSIAMGAFVTVGGIYVIISACKNIQERIIARPLEELVHEHANDSFILNVADALVRVATFQRESL